MSLSHDVPDIAKEKLKKGLAIDFVGIKDLQIPIQIDSQNQVPSLLSIFVSLDDVSARGIHMSRMYLAVHKHFENKTFKIPQLKKLLTNLVKDQEGLSHSSRVRLEFDWPTQKKALKSSLKGWRVYPCFVEANLLKGNKFEFIVGAQVTYSSTCPCSASLSQGLTKKAFEKVFSKKSKIDKSDVLSWLSKKESLVATPHAQKSTIDFRLKIKPESVQKFSILKCIDDIEKVLGTPVQTAVKREDEAEFARLNATHLMFCEDAVRKVASSLKVKKEILDYKINVQHFESLHPFTVESSIVKGSKDGWRA